MRPQIYQCSKLLNTSTTNHHNLLYIHLCSMKTSQKDKCLKFFNIQKTVPHKMRKSAEIPQSYCSIKQNKIQHQKQNKPSTTTKGPANNHTNRNIYLQVFGYERQTHKSFTLLCIKRIGILWHINFFLLLFKYLCNFIGLPISVRN